LAHEKIDLSKMALEVIEDLKAREPQRHVETAIQEGLVAFGDPGLLRIVLENLFQNAWKFTQKSTHPRIEFSGALDQERTVYCIKDNGIGFPQEEAETIFRPFQRLHGAGEFQGSGIGLATVLRIVTRHGGKIWAQGKPGEGAQICFVLAKRGEEKH